MTASAVHVEGLTKIFRDPVLGIHRAVDGISFECHPGRVFGLLGPNGAGKTTTLRMIATILQPTSGKATIAGADLVAEPDQVRRRIGFVTASTGVYERMTPREIMRFFGRLYGIDDDVLEARADELVRRFEMGKDADRLCGTLSSGNRQKANVARSVIHDPPVLIFDEPTANLDIIVARTVIDFIADCRARGRCVILSSHRMEEVERLCDDAAIIFEGKLLGKGSLDELRTTWSATSLEDVFFAAIGRRKAQGA